MEVLQAKNLKKIYGSGNNAVHSACPADDSGISSAGVADPLYDVR